MNRTTTPLRDLIAQRLDVRWPEFSRAHPHLAAAIDRTRVIEMTVAELRRDALYRRAMREADLDEAQLAQAAAVLERLESLLGLALPR